MQLPIELRLEIYKYLLVYPHRNGMPVTPPECDKTGRCRLLHPQILLTSRQINAEGTPVLCGQNAFLAHPTMLEGFPRLNATFPPVREVAVLPRIRRFYFKLRLDCDVSLRQEDVAMAFSGMGELVIDVWQAMFLGADHAALRILEGVRNVKRTQVIGSTTGLRHMQGGWNVSCGPRLVGRQRKHEAWHLILGEVYFRRRRHK